MICPSRIVVEHFSDSPHIQVKYITSTIAKVTEDGIETEDGQLVKQDIIICATGMKFNQNVSVILGLDLLKQDSMCRFFDGFTCHERKLCRSNAYLSDLALQCN